MIDCDCGMSCNCIEEIRAANHYKSLSVFEKMAFKIKGFFNEFK